MNLCASRITTSVQPFQKDWQHNHAQKEDKLKESFRDGIIVSGERPSSYNPYESEDGENKNPWRGFHALTLSRGTRPIRELPDTNQELRNFLRDPRVSNQESRDSNQEFPVIMREAPIPVF